MKTICITGGIGSGKSVVSRIMRLRGYAVYDCDYEARCIMETDGDLKALLRSRWGEEILINDIPDRNAIAKKVFSDADELRWLNQEVHSLVRENIKDFLTQKNNKDDIVFLETAIPNTSGLTSLCDEIWLVEAPEEIRCARACERDGKPAGEIRKRMAAQELEFADFNDTPVKIITNDGMASVLDTINRIMEGK